jgi:Fe-Mn family superoxide dismutase
MSAYVLPDLAFDPGALEPHVSGRIIELHHGKHHAAYVKNANTTLEQLQESRAKGDLTRIAALERALAFNLSGHVLHSVFWKNLTPKGGDAPTGALAAAIDKDFGGFDAFKKQMNEAAATIMGSGWAALCWEPVGKRLLVSQIYDHQSNVSQGAAPLMVIDAWEHAFYLQYENRKADFFTALWNLWNWSDIQTRFTKARELDLALEGAAK